MSACVHLCGGVHLNVRVNDRGVLDPYRFGQKKPTLPQLVKTSKSTQAFYRHIRKVKLLLGKWFVACLHLPQHEHERLSIGSSFYGEEQGTRSLCCTEMCYYMKH